MTQRDLVLARIRSAIASAARAPAHQAPPGERPQRPARQEAPPGDLSEQFVNAARAADARVSVASGPADACRLVGDILRAEGASQVLVSPEAAGDPWRCVETSALSGVTFIVRSPARNDLHDDVLKADAGITVPAWGLADTGTLVLASSAGDHRLDSLFPPVHIALLPASRLVAGLFPLFTRIAAGDLFGRHSALTFVRGPSRTADIELTLTIGVHGPKALYVVVVEDGPPPHHFDSRGPAGSGHGS